MSTYKRRGSLFPKTLGDVVKKATQPLMDKQGKLYGALLRDWATIVGPERATTTRPQCLKWPNAQAEGAVLHLDVAAAIAPELAYETEQLLEKCARYFGYKAIARIVIHPSHEMGGQKADPAKSPRERREAVAQTNRQEAVWTAEGSPQGEGQQARINAQAGAATKNNHVGSPSDMMDILQRMRQRIAGDDKRD